MKTTIHTYRFDTHKPEERAAYDTLRAQLKTQARCMESHGGGMHYRPELDGKFIELETAHLFDNQWNTAPIPGISDKGLRVFDWAQDYQPYGNPNIKQGHYLDITDEMRAIRDNTAKCGYCGAQEPVGAHVFCPHCLDSEYLTEKDLPLTRMRPVSTPFGAEIPTLSDAERAALMPKFQDAQLHGSTERGKARIAKARADVIAKCNKETRAAITERDGFLWFMDRGIRTDNLIFYSHTGRFCFGWRQPCDAALVSALLDIVSEFPFSYDIKCADGRTLSGD
jgi:hypothetical protein